MKHRVWLAGSVAFILCACQVHVPTLSAVNLRLYLKPGPAGTAPIEQLSVFVQAADGDGPEDLAYLYLVHRESQLCWPLDQASWTSASDSGSLWLGTNTIRMPDASPLPRGRWQLVLIDLAGQRSELEFSLTAPETVGFTIPALQLADDTVILTSSYDMHTVIFMDASDRVVKTATMTSPRASLDSLWGSGGWKQGADYLAVYGVDIQSEVGCFSWTIRLPD